MAMNFTCRHMTSVNRQLMILASSVIHQQPVSFTMPVDCLSVTLLGRLSFEPRPYQLVPLILALKQERIRLLISDDVGIGKTLESLLIAKELLDRREIDRFAVICLPHLCEQWQNEIKDKFGLDAEIIRSSTVTRLEKKLRGDQNIFRDIPYQVIH